MKLVIQTDIEVKSPLDQPQVFDKLSPLNARETSPPFEVEGKKFHYLTIEDAPDIDLLIEELRHIPMIQAAYIKSEEMPPAM
jgi:hypothetical protein